MRAVALMGALSLTGIGLRTRTAALTGEKGTVPSQVIARVDLGA